MSAQSLRDLVRLFCIRKLASQLYECVDGPSDRFELDQKTASDFLDKRYCNIVDIALHDYTAFIASELVGTTACILHGDRIQLTIVYDYPTFERLLGRFIWDAAYQTLKRALPKEYGRIRFP